MYACIRAANEITFAGKFPKSRKNREHTAARLSGLWWLGLQRLGLWRPYLAVPNPSSPQPISVPFSHLKMSRSQQLGTSTPFSRTRNTSRTMVRLPTSFPSRSAIPRSHRKIQNSVVETELHPNFTLAACGGLACSGLACGGLTWRYRIPLVHNPFRYIFRTLKCPVRSN